MKQLAVTLIILSVLIGLGWYFYAQEDVSPQLAITTPSGGEVWQTGEEHTITWDAISIPEDHLVSVSIRRIPPPPLQEEGQEFDPVIFVGLPNSGSATWEISSMYPSGTYVLSIHTYDALPATTEFLAESGEFTIERKELNADLYPLYPDADWQTVVDEDNLIGEETLRGYSAVSLSISAGMNPSSVFLPFESYYENKLTELGWTVENDLAAGGPMGGQTGYSKNGQTILIRHQTDFQNISNDAPSECPCDVTLSIFSTE